nr:oxygenase MpaB family protein [Spiractinospora alimapuensis]
MSGPGGVTFVSPESATWRVQLDRAMWVAGVRGLMLQALHPRAMRGVWQRSDFRDDPTGRLIRTAACCWASTVSRPWGAR